MVYHNSNISETFPLKTLVLIVLFIKHDNYVSASMLNSAHKVMSLEYMQ